MGYLATILLILLLISINAFFAASEIALISTRRVKLKLMKEDSQELEAIQHLLERPNEFLATIQICITLAGFFASATGAVSLSRELGRKLESTSLPILGTLGEELAVILVTFVISYLNLVLGELVPKRMALANPEKFALRIARPIVFLSRVFKPLVTLLSASTDFISRILGIPQESVYSVTDEELKLFIAEQRTLPPDERRLINEVFDFGDTLAYEVMTPRTDMVCIEDNATIKDALELSLQSHFSRLPVYQGDLDNIIGFVHIKDILPHLSKGDMNKPVREIMRPIHFVPLTKRAMELLKELQQKRINMAIVLDEYGGTAGLVTIEDLLEELVGEIRDEHDRETAPYRKIGDDEYLVDASLPIESLNELLGLSLPESEEFESVGGLIMELLGKVPEEGEMVEVDDYQLKVERMKGKRILTLRLWVKKKGEEENGEANYSS
ncbi:hemolysin family protein [Candidatus Sordicultor fermentans]|jgi:putative hemolysin|uniref:hemolysin family protein n=1 Tax=Candidatus Sordicultor fermentans TaxID=1953203 RepID=UPI0016BD23D5|nr:hemolysin family protein [Atribacterota bacterium]MDI9608454.1 hemolysin family protein [Atribacterota bacterium]MDY0134493.1 hemolysin family protein [Atribacterota bacterium]NLY04510.1 HlyC/CorC family transporter [Candidatus Atribacteria bacterium]HOQ51699.1 hemolysin family protein [Candidatus Atribacteria bacterium]